MQKIVSLVAVLLAALLMSVGLAGTAQAAPKKANAAWQKKCTTVTLAGPWKRHGLQSCSLVHSPPGQR